MKKTCEIDMCSGAVLPNMLRFAYPLILSNMLQLAFHAADVIVVGRFAGDEALAAVGSTGNVVALLINFFIGLSIGANVLVSRYYGAKQDGELRETVHTSIYLSLISGAVLTVLGLCLSKPMLRLIKVPEEILDSAALYLGIYFLGMTANMVCNFGSAILRAVGDTKRPMYYLTLAGVVNVTLNLLFVIVFKMDVAGVALATVVSQCISALMILRCLMKEQGAIRLDWKLLKIEPDRLRQLISIGLPASIESILLTISNFFVQTMLNGFGSTAVAAEAAGANIDDFIHIAMDAFYQAVLSFTSQNMGANRRDRINKVMFTGLGCAMTVGLVLSSVVICFGEFFMGLYTTSEDVIQMGLNRMQIMTRNCVLGGMQLVVIGALRGMGRSVLPAVVSVLGYCGVRVCHMVIASQIEQLNTLRTLYITYPTVWGFIFVVGFICYWREKRRLNF
ncbi:MAG: MATE family efflux transporter [Lachnospiraceae bacterium]|nr:MATE family efflux transporter [Lachnospiraceae bacterium]